MASENSTTSISAQPGDKTANMINREGYVWCSLFVAEAVLVIVLNISTIFVFIKNRRLRRRSTYLLINLSVTDICIGAFVIPTSVFRRGNTYKLWSVEMTYKWYISTYGIDTFFFGCSLVFLVSISIERLHATRNPFRHRLLSGSTYKKWIAGVWVASVIYTSITVSSFHFKLFGLYIWYVVAGCVLVSILILCASYIAIYVTVRCSKQPEQITHHTRKERKLTVTLSIVTVVSLTVWLPYVLFTFLELKLIQMLSEEGLLRVRSVCEVLFFANSFVNPILYTIRISEFRRAFCSLLVSKSLHSDMNSCNVNMLTFSSQAKDNFSFDLR